MKNNLREIFGNIDIYLFDQLLKGRFDNCEKVLDAGCGQGRNLIYLLRNGFEVYGIDTDQQSIKAVKKLAEQLIPGYPESRFITAPLEQLPFPDNTFDLVISSAVFHFAKNKQHFEAMLMEAWRVIKPSGFLFARMASDIGIEHKVQEMGDGKYLIPDGTERYLINESMLLSYTLQLKGRLFEPIKTTNVQNSRCMTTWCISK